MGQGLRVRRPISLCAPAAGLGPAGRGNGHTAVMPGAAVRRPPAPRAAILAPDQSALLRDRLVGEVAGIPSADQAAAWAREVLPAKNSLSAADAKAVEEAFERKLSELAESDTIEELAGRDDVDNPIPASPQPAPSDFAGGARVPGIDKSILAVGEPKRYRNKYYLRFVATQACLICGRKPSDPHHLRFTQPRALSRKVSDEFAVPLCRGHHREAHRSGNERAWWKAVGIEPVKVARRLWETNPPGWRQIRSQGYPS